MHKLLITGVTCIALGLSGAAFAAGNAGDAGGKNAGGTTGTSGGTGSQPAGGTSVGNGDKAATGSDKSDTTSQSKQPCPAGATDTTNCVKAGQ